MSYDRNLDYLNHRQIIYRTVPNQPPTVEYEWGRYYENGTYECYELFRSKAKINTYKSLKWHLLVLWYLNPSMDQDDFEQLAEVIAEPQNGFITFNIPKQLLRQIIYDVSMYDLEHPPKNRLRKVIFYVNCYLPVEEKLKIVGTLVGRTKKIHEDDIYEAMLFINDRKEKITIKKLATYLKCSDRTIYRTMGNTLKKEKELLNNEI
jgi:DNA-binding HxlR family transcriptional regulator